jgi:hypothetical protein
MIRLSTDTLFLLMKYAPDNVSEIEARAAFDASISDDFVNIVPGLYRAQPVYSCDGGVLITASDILLHADGMPQACVDRAREDLR